MAGMMEAIREYLRSHCDVQKALLAYIIRKKVIIHIFAIARYAPLDTKMIMRIVHLSMELNLHQIEEGANKMTICTTSCNIENRSVSEILDSTRKDTDSYPCIKPCRSKRN